MLKCTTRHVHIFAATVADERLMACDDRLTLDVDPDNELTWNDAALQKVYRKFDALVRDYSGRDLTEYYLRRIGSDLEHFIRALLQDGEVTYNLNSTVLNYSMGYPQVPVEQVKEQFIPPEH